MQQRRPEHGLRTEAGVETVSGVSAWDKKGSNREERSPALFLLSFPTGYPHAQNRSTPENKQHSSRLSSACIVQSSRAAHVG